MPHTVALFALCGALLALHVVADGVRGVPQSQQGRYASEVFTCLDGSVSFPSSQVNDDYCDCADGSDEPGTAACANGKFYCTNKGYRGELIHSAHVNDGICDCCDGSDEYLSGKCTDTCIEVGAAYRAARAEEIKMIEAGTQIKAEYIAKGKAALAVSQASLQEVTDALEAARAKQLEAQTAKDAAEELEREQQQSSGSNRDARVAALTLDKMDVPALQDLILKFAERADAADTLVELIREPIPLDDHSSVQWMAEETSAPVELPEAIQARTEFNAANQAVVEAENRERNLKKDTETDFGPDQEYYALKGQCFSVRVAQYEYKVCPFDSAKQDHTSLGSFTGWEEDGKVMAFTNGQHCWNGPNRSMRVTVECGDSNVLQKVDEPSMCAYTSVLRTPAACPSPKELVTLETSHKEL